jgi:hypothetical protein
VLAEEKRLTFLNLHRSICGGINTYCKGAKVESMGCVNLY